MDWVGGGFRCPACGDLRGRAAGVSADPEGGRNKLHPSRAYEPVGRSPRDRRPARVAPGESPMIART